MSQSNSSPQKYQFKTNPIRIGAECSEAGCSKRGEKDENGEFMCHLHAPKYFCDTCEEEMDADADICCDCERLTLNLRVRLEISCVIEELIGNHSEELDIDEESNWIEIWNDHPDAALSILDYAMTHFIEVRGALENPVEDDDKSFDMTKDSLASMEHDIRENFGLLYDEDSDDEDEGIDSS